MSRGMNAHEALSSPTQLLNETLGIARQLVSLLAAEHGALLHNDVGQLEQLTPQKASLAEQLGRRLTQLAPLAPAPQDPVLLASWQQLVSLAQDCQRQNDDNAQVLNQRQQHLRQSLQPLLRESPGFTYGNGGDTGLSPSARSLGRA